MAHPARAPRLPARLLAAAFVSLSALIASPGAALAAVAPALDEADLVRQADAIVVGVVEHVEEVRARTGLVLVRGQVRIIRALRGARVGDVVTVEVASVDAAPALAPAPAPAPTPASPRLVPGQLVLGFLEKRGELERPLGLGQGLLHVRLAPGGGLRVYREPPSLERAGASEVATSAAPEGERLDELVSRIECRLRVQAPRAGSPATGSAPAACPSPP